MAAGANSGGGAAGLRWKRERRYEGGADGTSLSSWIRLHRPLTGGDAALLCTRFGSLPLRSLPISAGYSLQKIDKWKFVE